MKKLFLLPIFIAFFSLSGFSQELNFNNENISFQITEIKAVGEQLHCKFIITAVESDETIYISLQKIRIFDTKGKEYNPEQGEIGKEKVTGKFSRMNSNIIAGVPVKGKIIFSGAVSKRKTLNLLEIPINIAPKETDVNIRFTNIIIPFGTSDADKKLLNNPLSEEIDDAVFTELKSITKKSDTLTFNFIVTNYDDDKIEVLNATSSKFIDDSGNEYYPNHISFGNDKTDGRYAALSKKCINEVPIKMTVRFTDSKIVNLKKIILLELGMNNNKFQFRDLTTE